MTPGDGKGEAAEAENQETVSEHSEDQEAAAEQPPTDAKAAGEPAL